MECSLTQHDTIAIDVCIVLILVLMEYSQTDQRMDHKRCRTTVLILVLMEDTLTSF